MTAIEKIVEETAVQIEEAGGNVRELLNDLCLKMLGLSGFDYTPWTPPFRYDEMGTRIVDSKEHWVLDVRGWGFLAGKGHGAQGFPVDEAVKIQNAFGEHIATIMNLSQCKK